MKKNLNNVRLVEHPRGDGTTAMVPQKQCKAFKILFAGMTPLQIATELSTKWISHEWYLWAFKRMPPNDVEPQPQWILACGDPAQLKLDLWP